MYLILNLRPLTSKYSASFIDHQVPMISHDTGILCVVFWQWSFTLGFVRVQSSYKYFALLSERIWSVQGLLLSMSYVTYQVLKCHEICFLFWSGFNAVLNDPDTMCVAHACHHMAVLVLWLEKTRLKMNDIPKFLAKPIKWVCFIVQVMMLLCLSTIHHSPSMMV